MMKRLVFSVMALVLAGVSAGAQGNPPGGAPAKPVAAQPVIPKYRFRILGVYDGQTFEPVEGVEVSDVLNGNKSMTTSTGTVSLIFMPEDGGFVRIRKPGYEVVTMVVAISPADTNPITVILNRATGAPMLQTIVSTDSSPVYRSPQLKGFQERSKAGFGYFVDEAEMRKREDQRLADVITAKVPGINMVRIGGNASYLTSQRPGMGGTCYPDVYLDGVMMAKVPDPRNRRVVGVDLSQFSVSTLGGMEFYAGGATTPAEYSGTGSGCGVLLLWTREK